LVHPKDKFNFDVPVIPPQSPKQVVEVVDTSVFGESLRCCHVCGKEHEDDSVCPQCGPLYIFCALPMFSPERKRTCTRLTFQEAQREEQEAARQEQAEHALSNDEMMAKASSELPASGGRWQQRPDGRWTFVPENLHDTEVDKASLAQGQPDVVHLRIFLRDSMYRAQRPREQQTADNSSCKRRSGRGFA